MSKQEIQGMMVNNLIPNRFIVSDDKKRMKRHGIVSPDINKMRYWIADTASKSTYYFLTEEKYRKKAMQMAESIDPRYLKFSHP